MKKIIKKWNYLNMYSIGEYESWLSDMAKKGLLLKNINPVKNLFLVSDPCEMDYRIVLSDKPMELEKIERYKKSAWNYVCSYKNFHVFSAFTTETMNDIEMDWNELKISLQSLTIKAVIFSFVMLIGIFSTIFLGYCILNVSYTPHINLWKGDWGIIGVILGMILIFSFSLLQITNSLHIRRAIP